MLVTILEPSGYCSGVERAMSIALMTKEINPQDNVVILGMLVHNKDSLNELLKHGINTIYKENCSLEQMIDEIKEPSTVILTAHGHSISVENKLKEKGHKIVDCTCPFVKNSFKEIVKAINKNRDVFYLGIENHPEAVAALSLSEKVHLIKLNSRVLPDVSSKNPLVISQTTLSEFDVKKKLDEILTKYPKAEVINGVCSASTARQKAIMNLDKSVDGLIIVGGKNSNNTKTLYNLAKSLYKNMTIILAENASEIYIKDLLGLSHIAIASGASTPKEIILDIKNRLLD